MSSRPKRDQCEDFARDCMRLAQIPNAPPEVREHLLILARDWMREAMEPEPTATENSLRERLGRVVGRVRSLVLPSRC
jgi:hypothetical protein